jgi:hypothetical protein
VHEYEGKKPVECLIEKPVGKPIAKPAAEKPSKKTEERDPDEPIMDESVVGHKGERTDPARFIFVYLSLFNLYSFCM